MATNWVHVPDTYSLADEYGTYHVEVKADPAGEFHLLYLDNALYKAIHTQYLSKDKFQQLLLERSLEGQAKPSPLYWIKEWNIRYPDNRIDEPDTEGIR